MLNWIELKFTEHPSDLRVPAQGITVFVGSNNSGKSTVLRELERVLKSSSEYQACVLLKGYSIRPHTEQQVNDIVERLSSTVDQSVAGAGFVAITDREGGNTRRSTQLSKLEILQYRMDPHNPHLFAERLLSYDTLRLDGRTRFALVDDKQVRDMLGPSLNWFMTLFKNDALRARARALLKDALGRYLVIDPTSSGQLRLRLSTEAPGNDEQSLNHRAREYHAAAPLVKTFSDGVQAYTGIIGALVAEQASLILLDEPEAFLHPPLAKKLGYQIASAVINSQTSVLMATHSSDILVGCLQGSEDINVVRLEYDGDRSKGYLISTDMLRSMYSTPLMRSANVISALFYDGVVVTESDNDRAFYGEIYHRLSEEAPSELPSILFLNAQNKQTTKDIVKPLRLCGIPAVAIVDIDAIKDGGNVWSGMLSAANFPDISIKGSAIVRLELVRSFEQAGKDMKRDGGINVLPTEARNSAIQLFDQLDDYGLFIVRGGELEHWLPELNIRSKKDWVIDVLNAMGSDRASSAYLNPTSGDVWDFVRKIMTWIRNANRKGL